MSKKKWFGVISGVVMLLIVSVGLSFAYFSATLEGAETGTTITVSGGTMKLIFNGGNAITVNNIYPREEAVATKIFTVSGNNTTELEMPYTVNLVVDFNTFSTDALSYTFISENTSNSGTPAPSITENTGIPTGAGTHLLGSATHVQGSGKIHTYTLNIYFLDTGKNQNADQGKIFGAHIGIDGGESAPICENCLNTKILAQEGEASVIEAKPIPDYSQIATSIDSGLYATEDEYGTSYYYRGDKNILNNNLIFAGFQWKIVRINGDGTIRIIYNGICPGGECTINNLHEDTEAGAISILNSGTNYNHQWNDRNDDAKYVGYMYGGANGEPSVCRDGEGCATANMTSSNAKAKLDSWYANNIANQGTSITTKIADNLFCNDRQLRSEVGGGATGTGIEKSYTIYASYYRLTTNKTPTLRCGLQNDRFTVDDITVGNGALEYPVGLLSADEASMAGLVNGYVSLTNYLYNDHSYWMLNPGVFSGTDASAYLVFSLGYPTSGIVTFDFGLRPVLNLVSGTTVSGEGSISNPYKVI